MKPTAKSQPDARASADDPTTDIRGDVRTEVRDHARAADAADACAASHVPPSAPSDGDEGDDDPRLLAAVREYMAALESGRRLNRQELLARHADIADELAACLDGLAFVHSAAGRIHGSSGGRQVESGSPEVGSAAGATAGPLGDFKLVREIGRGGMGVVYEAVQISLGRRVAVKVLPLASAFDQRHLQRFRNEAQAAAQLHHTNIVPVYAVGCDRGVHYYAMQLIEGQSLAEVIRDLRAAGGSAAARAVGGASRNALHAERTAARASAPASTALVRGVSVSAPTVAPSAAPAIPADNLTTLRSSKRAEFFRAAARIGLEAAEALDHAHSQGVVHRDVKPANLMLDGQGRLWVTDFGLAQFYADSNLTHTGDVLGTLRYMSPEQASGRAVVLDQRTDVYSLGVTLYELLTLEHALPGETREQLLYQLSYVDPRPARSVDRSIPPELETILAKATAKDPADRYATARALAEDLGRFLRDEPVRARPPSLWDKAVKWTRRHRSVAVSAVVVLLLAAVGLLVSTLLIAAEQRKTEAAYEAERQRANEASEHRGKAEASFRQAREAVDFFARVAADELGKPQRPEAVRKEMLEAALAYYQQFIEESEGNPELEAQLDESRSRVTAILLELSAFEELFRVTARAELLMRPAVREALGLTATPEQDGTDKFVPWFWTRYIGEDEDLHAMTPQEKRRVLARIAGEIEAELDTILSPEQAARLRQIARQVRGPEAFGDPDVVAALELTDGQRAQIAEIQESARPKHFGPGPGKRGGRGRDRRGDGRGDGSEGRGDGRGDRSDGKSDDGPEQRPRGEGELKRDAVREILTLLTASQVERWQQLVGEPVPEEALSDDRDGRGGWRGRRGRRDDDGDDNRKKR